MIPIYLNPASARIALIGRGPLAVRRLAWLNAGGATPDVWSDAPSQELSAASQQIIARLPKGEDLARYHVVWIADLPGDEANRLAHAARVVGVLVNVEDVADLCNFHSPAVVRRRRLTLTAATGGASPAVARAARERLEAAFPETWGEALDEIAASRTTLRKAGADLDALVTDARTRLAQRGLI
jgi:precorrin-2 dehydrogenase / sirohydrochlorin ferrochelatase